VQLPSFSVATPSPWSRRCRLIVRRPHKTIHSSGALLIALSLPIHTCHKQSFQKGRSAQRSQIAFAILQWSVSPRPFGTAPEAFRSYRMPFDDLLLRLLPHLDRVLNWSLRLCLERRRAAIPAWSGRNCGLGPSRRRCGPPSGRRWPIDSHSVCPALLRVVAVAQLTVRPARRAVAVEFFPNSALASSSGSMRGPGPPR